MADAGTLSGITVVEQGIGIAAAMCGKAMADLGADVVIVEPPEGSQGPERGDPSPARQTPKPADSSCTSMPTSGAPCSTSKFSAAARP